MRLVSLAGDRQIGRNLADVVLQPSRLTGNRLEAVCAAASVNIRVAFCPSPRGHLAGLVVSVFSMRSSVFDSVNVCQRR